jgi:hypothetical protein
MGEEGAGGGAISYGGEKAWSSVNHSILSGNVYLDLRDLKPQLWWGAHTVDTHGV